MKHILVMALLVFGVSPVLGQTEAQTKAQSNNETSQPATVPFSDFTVKIDLKQSQFEVRGTFTLGPKSDGINLFKEDVAIKVGDFSTTIPSGSFKQDGVRVKIRYKGLVAGVNLDFYFRVVGKASFEVKIEGEGANANMAKLLPEDVTLRVGDDGGTATAQTAQTQ